MKTLRKLVQDHFQAASNITRNGSKKNDDLVKLLNDISENSNIVSLLSDAAAGGAGTEALTVTGLKATDTILSVSQSVVGANDLPLLSFDTQIDDGLTVNYSADPGAGSKILVLALRLTVVSES